MFPSKSDSISFQSFPLQQAVEAGVVSAAGDISVDQMLERVFLNSGEKIHIARLKCPLRFRPATREERAGLLCPPPWETYVASAAKAARTYHIPTDLRKYEVRTIEAATKKEMDLPGTYYLLSDLAALPKRDLRQEKADRKARLERLVAQYGPDLPDDYEEHSDQELSTYYKINELIAQGEIIAADQHPLVPNAFYSTDRFLSWIKNIKPDFLVTCPLTGQRHLWAAIDMDQLADLPDFCETVDAVLGEPSFIRKLMLSRKAQAAVLAHSI